MSEATVRETKEVEIKGHKLVVLTYITGRELQETQRALMEQLELSQNGGKAEVTGLNGAMMLTQSNKYIEIIVKSVDGKTEKVLDEVLDLPSVVSTAIIEYVNAIATGKDPASN